jgi:hypothetical protein
MIKKVEIEAIATDLAEEAKNAAGKYELRNWEGGGEVEGGRGKSVEVGGGRQNIGAAKARMIRERLAQVAKRLDSLPGLRCNSSFANLLAGGKILNSPVSPVVSPRVFAVARQIYCTLAQKITLQFFPTLLFLFPGHKSRPHVVHLPPG